VAVFCCGWPSLMISQLPQKTAGGGDHIGLALSENVEKFANSVGARHVQAPGARRVASVYQCRGQ
jgi:hypothetical protein